MKNIIKLALFIFVSLALSPVFGDAAWLIVAVIWVAGIGAVEWFDGIEERARKAQADATMRGLAAIHDEMMRSVGHHSMVGKSSFHKSKE